MTYFPPGNGCALSSVTSRYLTSMEHRPQRRYQGPAFAEDSAVRSLDDNPPVSIEKASSNVSNSEYSQSTGKLDANMHRSVPNVSIVASTHGRKSSGVHVCIT